MGGVTGVAPARRGEPHRPGLAADEGQPPLHPGLQRAGGRHEQQIAIAAEITTDAPDFSQLRPMIETALHELEIAGLGEKPTVAVADAQYWNEQHMDHVPGEHGIEVLISPDSDGPAAEAIAASRVRRRSRRSRRDRVAPVC